MCFDITLIGGSLTAGDILQVLLEKEPSLQSQYSAFKWSLTGFSWLYGGETDRANEAFQAATALQGDFPPARVGLGLMTAYEGDYGGAAGDFAAAAQWEPAWLYQTEIPALVLLIQNQVNDQGRADALLDEIAQRQEGDGLADTKLTGPIWVEKRHGVIVDAYTAVFGRNPSARLLLRFGDLLQKVGDTALAHQAYQRALALDPLGPMGREALEKLSQLRPPN